MPALRARRRTRFRPRWQRNTRHRPKIPADRPVPQFSNKVDNEQKFLARRNRSEILEMKDAGKIQAAEFQAMI